MRVPELFIRPSKVRELAVFALLGALVFGAYGGAVRNGFVMDDHELIEKNPLVANLSRVGEIFSSDLYRFSATRESTYYRPLQLLSYALDRALLGRAPAGFHVVNLLLHVLNAFLLYILARRWLGSAAAGLAAAALHAVYPLNVSAVAYASGRADLLALFFLLTALLLVDRFLEDGSPAALAGAATMLLSALLSRENALLFPLLVPLGALARKTSGKRTAAAFGVAVLVTAIYAFARRADWSGSSVLGVPDFSGGFAALATYLKLSVFPVGLRPMRALAAARPADVALGAALFLAAGAWFAVSFGRGRGREAIGAAWFLAAALPVFRLAGFFPELGVTAAEHWFYLPSIGLFLWVAPLARHRRAQVLFLAVTLAWAAAAHAGTRIWKNDVVLYETVLKASPKNTRARVNLAAAYLDDGRTADAVKELELVRVSEPSAWDVHLGLGNAYRDAGDLRSAERAYERARVLNPMSAEAWTSLGAVYEMEGKTEEAREALERAVEINPDLWQAKALLGDWHLKRRNDREARRWLEEAQKMVPSNASVLLRLGVACGRLGDAGAAMRHFEAVLRSEPDSVEARKNLGITYANQGRLADAERVWTEAAKLAPDDATIQTFLSRLREKTS